MQKKAISLVGFSNAQAIRDYLGEFDDMQVELSYKMSEELLDAIAPHIEGRVASVHACCPKEPFFPNFGSHDQEVLDASHKAIERSFRTASRFGSDILVLHPGYVTDFAIPSDNQKRKELLDHPSFQPYVFKQEGSICTTWYNQSDVYRHHAQQATRELEKVAQMGKKYGVRLAAENLNPRIGYLFHTPEEMLTLIQGNEDIHICLDVGHLWIASCLYGFDYFAGIQMLLDTNRVINCHLHANSSNRTEQRYADDHSSLDAFAFPYGQVLELLLSSDANLVLETVDEARRNTLLLTSQIEKKA